MSSTTPKWGIPYSLGSDIANTIDNTDLARATLLDGLLTPYDAGARGARPASTPGTPGKAGRTYRSTADGGVDLDIGTAWATVMPGLFTALPATPHDGMEIHFLADAVNGIIWRLRYRAASASAFKWEFIGGSPITAESLVDSSVVSSVAYIQPTPGVAVTTPLAGDYIVEHGTGGIYASGANFTTYQSVKFGAAVCLDRDGFGATPAVANVSVVPGHCQIQRNGLAAGTGITVSARTVSTAATATLRYRRLALLPVRVG